SKGRLAALPAASLPLRLLDPIAARHRLHRLAGRPEDPARTLPRLPALARTTPAPLRSGARRRPAGRRRTRGPDAPGRPLQPVRPGGGQSPPLGVRVRSVPEARAL